MKKVNAFDLIRTEKDLYVLVAKIDGKNESSIHEIMKKKKEIRAIFSVIPQTAKVMAIPQCKISLYSHGKGTNMCMYV